MRLTFSMPALAFLAVACATTPSAPALPDASVIEAAERAFAADAGEHGWVASFKTHAAADAIVIWGDPGDAHQQLASQPAAPPDTSLRWHPLWVGIARSGDFGFSTGPVINGDRHSQYFSIWRKEADGTWKWIYDGGFGSSGPSSFAYDAPAAHAALSTDGVGASADREVHALEDALANASVENYRGALRVRLAEDGRLLGSRAQPASGAAALDAELASRPAKVSMGTLGFAQSSAGDMAYTYGSTLWVEDGEVIKRGYYVRVWRRDAPDWRIVADVFLPKRT